jgi:hypothetical protein
MASMQATIERKLLCVSDKRLTSMKRMRTSWPTGNSHSFPTGQVCDPSGLWAGANADSDIPTGGSMLQAARKTAMLIA